MWFGLKGFQHFSRAVCARAQVSMQTQMGQLLDMTTEAAGGGLDFSRFTLEVPSLIPLLGLRISGLGVSGPGLRVAAQGLGCRVSGSDLGVGSGSRASRVSELGSSASGGGLDLSPVAKTPGACWTSLSETPRLPWRQAGLVALAETHSCPPLTLY